MTLTLGSLLVIVGLVLAIVSFFVPRAVQLLAGAVICVCVGILVGAAALTT